jgi:glycosyltransferase involved in cell wall biosynthesis
MVGKYIMESGLINKNFDTRYINLGTSSSVDEIGKGGFKKLVKYLSILFLTVKNIILFRPHIAYIAMTAKGGAFYKDVLIALLLKTFHVKLVIHFHNKGVAVHQEKKLDNYLYLKVFKNTKVILLSKYLYSDVQKYVAEKDVFYCPNGIPEISLDHIDRKNKKGTVNLLFLSNLIESKGVFILLEALHRLHNKSVDFNCNFIGGEGDVSATSFREKVEAFGLTNKVKYLGKKYGDEKHEYFLKADVFVFPTFYHNETFGLVNLEAMQYSLPIISTFEGGIPDVVQDGVTGLLVAQKNVEALVERIETLINNGDLRFKMGENGRKRFKEKFTIRIFEGCLNQILQQIAG